MLNVLYAGDDEDLYCFVTAAVKHISRYVGAQRCHRQSKSEVEHDAFPPGDEVFFTRDACCTTHIPEFAVEHIPGIPN